MFYIIKLIYLFRINLHHYQYHQYKNKNILHLPCYIAFSCSILSFLLNKIFLLQEVYNMIFH